MDKIEFVDQTIRLGQQSLWAFMMRTDMISPTAPMMDQVGFKEIATVGSNGFVVQIRNLQEDPWERIRLLSGLMNKTPLRGSYQVWGLADFDQNTPRDIISLWIRRSVANGIRSFWVCDYQTDMEKFAYFARIAKSEGAKVVVTLVYASSPVHTSEHWARNTRLIAEVKDCVDAIQIADPGGVLLPENTKELVRTVQRNCDDIPIEFMAQCNTGLAPLSYLEAIKAGVRVLNTSIAPLANGTSCGSTENILRNARRLGFSSDIDEDALAAVSDRFRKIADKEGLPIGIPMEYDLAYFDYQVPGGMMTNLKRQLKEVGMEHRLDEVLEEVVQVRKEFGYPVMATPFSQMLGAQAVDNVISGERYGQVTDATIKYVLGYYGEPAGVLDQNLVDKVMSLPRTKELLNWKPEKYEKSIEKLRDEIGEELSDEDFLLRCLTPGKSVKFSENMNKSAAPFIGAKAPVGPSTGFPAEYTVDVDGELFNVKIIPKWEDAGNVETAVDAERADSKRHE
ncbi:MAG: hypothetical protein JRJ45_01765, partial [Deltaproteobacteria bacterium]|nr:hypothetical protein [Deltaproteobacteria bacterium]